MFNGKKYKKDALLQLNKNWKIPCLASFIGFAVLSCLNVDSNAGPIVKILSVCIFGIIFTAHISLFLKIANIKSYSGSPEHKICFGDFISGFANWLSSLLGILWFCLWTWLWTLLFFFPGIVKAVSYSMMFWVIAENPGISAKKAMNISKVMTNGHKGDIFCLFMSFFGWFLLGCLSCGIGFIWIHPYVTATMTNAYYDLKLMAFETKKLKPSDFSI